MKKSLSSYYFGKNKIETFEKTNGTPFPQANDISKVIRLCEMTTHCTEVDIEDVMSEFDFTERQAYMYLNAGIYLGLIRRVRIRVYTSTGTGSMIGTTSREDCNSKLSTRIISRQPFNATIMHQLIMGHLPEIEEIVVMMKADDNINFDSAETYIRRASTVYAWSKWVIENNEIDLISSEKDSTYTNMKIVV